MRFFSKYLTMCFRDPWMPTLNLLLWKTNRCLVEDDQCPLFFPGTVTVILNFLTRKNTIISKKKILCLIVQSFFPKFSLASSLYTFLSLPLIFLFLQLLAPLINITSSWSGILIIKYVSLPFP